MNNRWKEFQIWYSSKVPKRGFKIPSSYTVYIYNWKMEAALVLVKRKICTTLRSTYFVTFATHFYVNVLQKILLRKSYPFLLFPVDYLSVVSFSDYRWAPQLATHFDETKQHQNQRSKISDDYEQDVVSERKWIIYIFVFHAHNCPFAKLRKRRLTWNRF